MGTALRIADLEVDQRPRERMSRLGARALTDAELVAVLLGSGGAGTNAIDLAQSMISSFGGLAGLAEADVQDLLRVKGVGMAAAARVCAAAEIGRRASAALDEDVRLQNSAEIAKVVSPLLRDAKGERLVVVVLNRALRLIDTVVVAEGTTTHASCPIADVLRTVLVRNGSAFALAHNHPGGSTEPSTADMVATEAVRGAAAACGLRFVDHLVVAGTRWSSVSR